MEASLHTALLFLLTLACHGKDPECGGPWFADADGDGHGDAAAQSDECELPEGHVESSDDCDDDDASAYPGATEQCDEVDNNCDGTVDEGVQSTFYADGDGDGYGVDGDTLAGCTAPTGYAPAAGDCDDTNPSLSPGADEICDSIDNNCDGETDESTAIDALDWYADADEDGFGDPRSSQHSCAAPSGYTTDNTDCDDSYDLHYPGAAEICNDGVVNDCDGTEDAARAACQLAAEIDLEYAGSRMYGIERDDGAGNDVAEAGDPSGDGFADVLIGASGADARANNAGAAYVVAAYAGEPDLSYAYLRLLGESAEDRAGTAVAGGGSLRVGGFAVALVGAIGESSAASNAGAVYLVTNEVTGTKNLEDSYAVMYGVSADDQAGAAMAVVGDLNGDGTPDLVVGAPGNDGGGSNAGAVYVVSGTVNGSFGLGNAAQHLNGENAGDFAGSAVCAAGDVNGDGVADYAVGAYAEDSGGVNAGSVYVMFGPVGTRTDLSWASVIYRGDSNGDYAGFDVAGGEDLDGDGHPELLIGAPRNGNQDNGAAWLVSPSLASSSVIDLGRETNRLTGERFEDYLGSSVAFAGDVDGDGQGDLLVGAPGADTGGAVSGAAYLFVGPVSGTVGAANARSEMSGAFGSDAAGTSVSRAGDVDGDGHQDMLIGAIGEDTNGDEAGAAYIVFGPGF